MRLAVRQNSEVPVKTIPENRDKLQSVTLTAVVLATLLIFAITSLLRASHQSDILISLLISLVFGTIVRLLKAATWGGVAAGTLICFTLLSAPTVTQPPSRPNWTSLLALITLFVISFAATRFGRSRKETSGLAESRRGRQASQIVANLGAAALFAAAGSHIGCIAALAEAAGDTASSEIGQALGGRVRLITSLRTVPSGTDGGVTLYGTVAGVLSASIVGLVGSSGSYGRPLAITIAAGCSGLFFDSFLGATLEREGWLGNDIVNFSSTVFAGIMATLLA